MNSKGLYKVFVRPGILLLFLFYYSDVLLALPCQHDRWRDVTKVSEAMESLDYGTSDKATYLKITLSKLVLFINSMSYHDYQSQHSRFVMREGNRDRHTDSWATIEGM